MFVVGGKEELSVIGITSLALEQPACFQPRRGCLCRKEGRACVLADLLAGILVAALFLSVGMAGR